MSGVATLLPRCVPSGTGALTLLAVLFSLAVGLAAGDPGSGMLLPVGAILGLGVVTLVMVRPFAGFLSLVFSIFLLTVVRIPDTTRGVNAFDLVLLPALFASWFGSARRTAAAEDARLTGVAHSAIRAVTSRFTNSALLYFGLAALSLLPMVFRIGLRPAVVSGLSLFRVLQGASVFMLAVWWLRDARRLEWTLRTTFAAAIAFVVVNCVWVFAFGVPRAGIVWWVTEGREAIGSPNEAAVALIILWAVARARHAVRPSRWLMFLMTLVVVMLPLTQSRSGLLAFVAFLLLSVRRLRWRWVLAGLAAVSVALLVTPETYWGRLGRSLTLTQGSFEMYSFLVRVYGFQVAWEAFLANPLVGLGYLSFRYVSPHFAELHIVIGQAENFLLETLVSLGLTGAVVVGVVFARLWVLGRAVRRVTPPGTLGHELARLHLPLLAALVVANLTGSTFVGMVGVGQVALWAALLVRAGHLAIPRAESA